MKKILTILALAIFLFGCASQKPNCGSKSQKKAKYKMMKSGKSPGGGMLH